MLKFGQDSPEATAFARNVTASSQDTPGYRYLYKQSTFQGYGTCPDHRGTIQGLACSRNGVVICDIALRTAGRTESPCGEPAQENFVETGASTSGVEFKTMPGIYVAKRDLSEDGLSAIAKKRSKIFRLRHI